MASSTGTAEFPALATLRDCYGAKQRAARAFRTAGGRVVGTLSAHVPQELILAAGMFPVLLWPDFSAETPTGDRYMEPFFDGPIRSLFERMLTGAYDFADLVVVPRAHEGLLQLHYFIEEARRWETGAGDSARLPVRPSAYPVLVDRPLRARPNRRFAQSARTRVRNRDVGQRHRGRHRAGQSAARAAGAIQRAAPARRAGGFRRRRAARLRHRLDHEPRRTLRAAVRLAGRSGLLPRSGRVACHGEGQPARSARFYDLVEDAAPSSSPTTT